MAGHSSASYCVCKPVSDDILQSAIDYACAQGADCNPIKQNGQCYNPNSVRNHCSYAVNSYYQKKAASGATCDFGGAATLTNSDPSGGGCSFSATSSSPGTGGTTSPVTTVPSTTPTGGSTTPMTPSYGTGTGTGSGTSTGTGTGTSTGSGTGIGMPSGTSPYGATPTAGGTLGGVGTGMGPTASSMDENHARVKLVPSSALLALVISGIVCWWN